MHSIVKNKKDYQKELHEMLEELGRFVNSKEYTIKTKNNGTLHTENIVHLLSFLKTDTQLKSIIRDVIIETCKSTTKVGGDDKLVLNFMFTYMNELFKHNLLSQKKIKHIDVEKLKQTINSCRTYPQFSELKKEVYKQSQRSVADIVIESYKLAGLTGKIFIDKKNIPEPQIELISGNIFNLHVNNQFLNGVTWENKNIKCLIVEGIIEGVHEIHRILEEINKTKQPLIIFATGFSDDVLSTLYTNKVRGTLDVVPVRIMSSMENINTLKDLSIVCKSELISSLKGQTLTSFTADDLSTVDRIICSQKTIIIQNNNEQEIHAHLKYLLDKKNESNINDVKDLLDKRIKSMTSNYVQISIPDNIKYKEDEAFEKINNCIHMLKTLISRGFVNMQDVFNYNSKGLFNDCLLKTFKSLNVDVVSTNTLLAILNYGIVNAELLVSVNAAVVSDN
mgnify:CR=1 FL=1|jgi:hypothetical protein